MSELPGDPYQLARACSAAMQDKDDATKFLGIEIVDSQPGSAQVRMTVRKEMTNGHDICHGGIIFSLADTSFAYACNSANRITVASGCSIEFLAPSVIDDVLTATANEVTRSRRTGIYDVEVTNQDNRLIAVFRGKSHQLKGQLIEPSGNPS